MNKIVTIGALTALLGASACAANPSRFAAQDDTEAAEAVAPAEEATVSEAPVAKPVEEAKPHHHASHTDPAAKHHTHDHAFTNPDKWAERWNAPERDEWQRPEEVIAIMGVKEGQTVADLGTGTGYFVPFLHRAVGPTGKVMALDVSQDMVDYVARMATLEGWANVQARLVPMDSPGVADGTIDALVTVNTWHHISDREGYAKKLYAALKPGGRVVVVDYTKEAAGGPPPEMRLDPSVVIRELGAGGFAASQVSETLPKQYVVVGTKP